MHRNSSFDDQHSNDDFNGRGCCPDKHEIDANVSRRRYWMSLRRQGSSRTPKKLFSVVTTNFGLGFLLVVSYFLLNLKICRGSEDAASSFQSPPPPPPGSSFPTHANGAMEGHGEKNRDGGYYHRVQQQGMPPSQDKDEFYNHSGETRQVHLQSDRFSSPQGKQQENPSLPIHYEFPISAGDNTNVDGKGGQRRRHDKNEDGTNDGDNFDVPLATSSARKDLVSQYWSTKTGKVQIQTVMGFVGYGSGNFVARSIIRGSDVVRWTGYCWATFLVVSTWFRTPMGELSRAVGLSLILVLQRTQRIRREYPTWRYVAASIGIIRGGPRDARGRPKGPRPFPPSRNPWRYTPRSPRDPDFNMIYALVSMAIVGSTVGGNLPVIPNWIGALVGASSFAFACTWQNSHRGDLARTMGMRVVRVLSELWEIQAELQIIPKATVVSSQVIDKAMILDRKHRVKDRFLSFANKGYAQASKVAERIQKQQRGGNNEDKSNNDIETDRSRYNDNNRYGRRTREDDDLQRGEQDNGWGRDSHDRRRKSEGDSVHERRDGRSQKGRYRDDDDNNDDRFVARDRSYQDQRQENDGRYEVETDDRDGKFASRRRENYDFDGGGKLFNESKSEKKQRGLFFGKK